MEDLIGKYLVKEMDLKAVGERGQMEMEIEEEMDNMEFELSKFVDKMFKKSITKMARKTGLKKREVRKIMLDSLMPDSDLYGLLPRL